jgi:hypothetical protein
MTRLALSLLVTAIACTSVAATAGDGSGMVTRLTTYGNAVIFSVQSHPSPAPCAPGGAFVVDGSTSQGKLMYAAILTAVASSKPISVYGSNVCPSWWGDSETPNSVTINP